MSEQPPDDGTLREPSAPAWGDPVPAPGRMSGESGQTATAERRRPPRSTTTTALRPRPDRRPRERPPIAPRPAPIIVSRRDRRRIRIVERFSGGRVRSRVGVWRRLRSVLLLILLGALLAAALAAVGAAIVAGLAVAFHHASGS